MNKNRDGFSLVEVIIAVALLAILCMPILAYFTHASVATSDGKDTHRANMAAQSAAEELKGCETFEQIEEKLAAATGGSVSGAKWTIDSAYDGSTKKAALTKLVTEDGFPYQVKVTLDYNYGITDAHGNKVDVNGNEIDADYNDYSMPKLKEVYADTNVVISETDQVDTAVSNFLYSNPSKSESEIKNNMERTLCLNVSKKNSDIYKVRGYYHYRYTNNGKTYTYSADVEDTEIEISKLENIYFFYNIMKDDAPEPVEVDFDFAITQAEAEKLHVYFVCQREVKAPKTGYSLNFDTSHGQAAWAEYYTNGVATNLAASSDMIQYDTSGKRIAKILIDVYAGSETSFTEATRIVHLETSKGE